MQQSGQGDFREDYDFLVTRSQQLYGKKIEQILVNTNQRVKNLQEVQFFSCK